MRIIFRSDIACIIMVFFLTAISCNNQPSGSNEKAPDTSSAGQSKPAITPLREKVLTAAEQEALSPDSVIQSLKDGNKRFLANDLTARDHSAMVRNASKGQYPKAVILSCLDSRIPVEDVFDKGIGDLFVARVAGNFVNEDILGSMEFGCKVSGAKVILVIGHESCGAIKAAIDNVKLGNITAMLAKIKPAVEMSKDFNGDKSSKNDAYVEYVAKKNVLNTIETIKSKSAILAEMVQKGQIKIIGAYYHLQTGAIEFL
ncbi:MAG TPA: carbonic anhydrase family protein [Puia sp.]|nr:carbonic anhydrase family protein [Puia sp.]